MKKTLNLFFGFSLGIWFICSLLLSLSAIVGLFTEFHVELLTDIFAISFLTTASVGIYNWYNGRNLSDVSYELNALKEERAKKGCKTCKQKGSK